MKSIVLSTINDFQPFTMQEPDRQATTNKHRAAANLGIYKTKAVLKAMVGDGRIHLRPLCTSGDVLLAIHELMESDIFIRGAVQIPMAIRGPNIRQDEGYFRYLFRLNSSPQWQYFK